MQPDHTSPGDGPGPSPAVELGREECLDLLAATSVGRLAVNLPGWPPVIRPVNYLFDRPSQSVLFRSARGSKLHALLHAAQAAFEIDGVAPDGGSAWSVVIVGVAQELTEPAEIARLERSGLDSWAPGPEPHWLRIRAGAVSGRRIAIASGPVVAPSAKRR